MNRVRIDLDEKFVRKAITRRLAEQYGIELENSGLVIEVKSKQNYKSEWEQADWRCHVFRELVP